MLVFILLTLGVFVNKKVSLDREKSSPNLNADSIL